MRCWSGTRWPSKTSAPSLQAASATILGEDLAHISPLLYQHVIPNRMYHCSAACSVTTACSGSSLTLSRNSFLWPYRPIRHPRCNRGYQYGQYAVETCNTLRRGRSIRARERCQIAGKVLPPDNSESDSDTLPRLAFLSLITRGYVRYLSISKVLL